MATHNVNLETWPRAAQYKLFRGYAKPHYAVTSRINVSQLVARKSKGLSTYRASLFAIGAGIHAVPELCMRFRGDTVVRHDIVTLSMTVPTDSGSFGYGYVPYQPGFDAFDREAKAIIDAVAKGAAFDANEGERDDLAYLSCMPWLDYTSINNALPDADDCIPRISWGKFVQSDDGWDMAMTIEVHHALVDGAQVGAFFATVQQVINRL